MESVTINLSDGKEIVFADTNDVVEKVKTIYKTESEVVFAELMSKLILHATVENVLEIIKACKEDVDCKKKDALLN